MSTPSRILDRRYQRYTGPRKGQAHATWRLVVHSFQRLLGLRRPFKYKIVPILLGLACFAFPLGLIAIAAFVPGGAAFTFGYAQLFAIISTPIFLFVVITAPNGLITDRNSKSLSLYLASPLSRNTYLLAHAAAVAAVLALVTIGPLLLYFLSLVIQGNGPEGLSGFGTDLGRILLAGAFLAFFYGAITTAAGAFADRPSIAAGAIFIGFALVAGALEPLSRKLESDYIQLLSPGTIDDQLIFRIFDVEPFANLALNVPTWALAAAAGAWIVALSAATWYRYRRLVVSR